VVPRVVWLSINPIPLFLPYELLAESKGPSAYKRFVNNESALLSAWHGHHPSSHMLSCPPSEWRLPHTIAQYNRAARDVAEQLEGVDFFDSWPVVFPLLDLSFDGLHYQYPVGPYLAARLLYWLLKW